MKYTIAYARGIRAWEVKEELEQEVKQLIEEGWKPEGCANMAFDTDADDYDRYIYMLQTMVKTV